MRNLLNIRWKRLALLFFFVYIGLILLYLLDTTVKQVSANEPTSQQLFIHAGRERESSTDEATVMRSRLVYINFGDLKNKGSSQFIRERLTLNLFEQVEWVAHLDHIESNPSGSYTWKGHLEGMTGSQVFFVVKNNVMIGKIITPRAQYHVRYVGHQLHEVVQIDPSAYPELSHDTIMVNPPSNRADLSKQPTSHPDDGSVVDVLVLYTAEALVGAGGTTDAIENIIDLAVSETNQAYQNSEVNQRLFVVHTAQVYYTETEDSAIDLFRLRRANDGFMDEAHTLRNTYHADHVILMTQSGYCGFAYVQSQAPDASFEPYAFGLVRQDCAVGNLTFAHELGHNMGLRHDWYQDDHVTPTTYAHGYVNHNLDAPWRTVMAYNNLCSDQGFSCPRLPFFSNPNLSYDGIPMGIESGQASNCVKESLTPNPSTCDADSHQVLNTTTATVAQFRVASTTWLGNSTQWDRAENWSTGIVPRFMDDVIIPSSPSGGYYPIISDRSQIRSLVIEHGATLSMVSGVLDVYGQWEEEGTGRFSATGGTVIFKSYLDQTILMSSTSSFHHLQLGDGTGSQIITALNDIDINGNLSLMAGISFNADQYAISVAGNWSDQGNGFIPSTSTVIFDGKNQKVTKVTTSILLEQDFSYRNDSDGFFGLSAPPNWTTEDAGDGIASLLTARWLFGDSTSTPNIPYYQAYARRWYDPSATVVDAWLFTPQISLYKGVAYQLQFNYGVSSSNDAQDFAAYYGSSATSMDMTTQILTITNASNNSWSTAKQDFTVPTSGPYHLGLRNHDLMPSSGRAGLDNIILTAQQGVTFYNLEVHTTGEGLTLNSDIAVQNHVTVGPNGLLNLGRNEMTVEKELINHGGLQQSKDISDESGTTTYHFLNIQNVDRTKNAYYGVDITPDSQTALDLTTVRILGHQDCTDNPADLILQRCFEISPTTPASATIRYWFSEAERNQQAANNIKLWDHNGTNWDQEGQSSLYGSTSHSCANEATCWYQWANVDHYSPMTGGSHDVPTGSPIANLIMTPQDRQTWLPLLIH